VHAARDSWHRHFESQRDHWFSDQERWAQMHSRLDKFQTQLEHIDAQVKSNSSNMSHLETVLRDGHKQVTSAIGEVLHQVGQETLRSMLGTMVDNVCKNVQADNECTKQHLTSLLHGAPEEGDTSNAQRLPSLVKILSSIHERVCTCETYLVEDISQWRDSSNKWSSCTEKAKHELTRLKSGAEDSQEQLGRCRAELKDLRSNLQQTQHALEAACAAPGKDIMKRLKDIEERGRVSMNRQSGHLEVLKQLDFKGRSANDAPTAEFKDVEISGAVIADLAEISGMFNVPTGLEVHIKPGKGGTPQFWDALAQSRADLVKETLAAKGLARDLVAATGYCHHCPEVSPHALHSGVKIPCVLLRLDKNIFPVTDEDKDRRSNSRSKKSPRR